MEIVDMMKKVVSCFTHTFSPTEPLVMDTKYRGDIDGLRAIAVISVIIFHVFPTFLPGGFIGVDVFFVISGYLISSIICDELDTNSFSFAQFYGRRIRRIFPSLIVVLVTCYVVGWYLLLPAELRNLGIHLVGASGFFSNILSSKEWGYFQPASDSKPLLHLWSLGIEEQFYIIWPFLLYMSRKIKLNLLILTIILILSSFTLNVIKVKTHKNQTFYWPTSRVWELLIGALVIFISKYRNNDSHNVIKPFYNYVNSLTFGKGLDYKQKILCMVTSIGGVLLITFPIYFLTNMFTFPGWWAVSPTLGTAFLISSGPTAWINKNILSCRFLVTIGLISYPLYLWHWSLFVFTRMYFGNDISNSIRISLIILSMIVAWMTYIFIERPCRFGQFLKAKTLFLCVSMFIIGLVGYYTYRSDGLLYRLPPTIRNIAYYDNIYSYRDAQTYRPSTCFLHSRWHETNFSACADNIEKNASTTIMLWGDSHAAHLRPGIDAAKPDFRIIQRTASECPPIYGFSKADLPSCRDVNDYVFKQISYEKPNTVMLAACWSGYDWQKLIKTIEYLRNANIKNIYLIGPVPYWPNGLPRTLYNYYLRNRLQQIPTRMHFGLSPYIAYLDKLMENFAINMTINYISPYKILCNSDGCLTKTGESMDTITSYDHSHLTIAGSTFVVAHFPKNLLHAV